MCGTYSTIGDQQCRGKQLHIKYSTVRACKNAHENHAYACHYTCNLVLWSTQLCVHKHASMCTNERVLHINTQASVLHFTATHVAVVHPQIILYLCCHDPCKTHLRHATVLVVVNHKL